MESVLSLQNHSNIICPKSIWALCFQLSWKDGVHVFLRLNITPYFESDVEVSLVEGDPRALEQVFTNLISNSANAMSEKGGPLSIRISESEQQEERWFLEITITDTGPGIPDEIKSHMFIPFVTGSNRGTDWV